MDGKRNFTLVAITFDDDICRPRSGQVECMPHSFENFFIGRGDSDFLGLSFDHDEIFSWFGRDPSFQKHHLDEIKFQCGTEDRAAVSGPITKAKFQLNLQISSPYTDSTGREGKKFEPVQFIEGFVNCSDDIHTRCRLANLCCCGCRWRYGNQGEQQDVLERDEMFVRTEAEGRAVHVRAPGENSETDMVKRERSVEPRPLREPPPEGATEQHPADAPVRDLGLVATTSADSIKYRVEQLLESLNFNRPLDNELAQWVKDLEPWLAKRLAGVGLITASESKPAAVLGAFLKMHLDGRNDLKPATKIVRGHVVRDLSEFFGENCNVRTITPGRADDFKQWLIGKGLASTTIHKRLQVARSFFHAMQRRKLIEENPFDGVKAAATGIKDRTRFITHEMISRVFDACPNHDWRTIVALSRFGGLRCPSEVLSLRWRDVDWDADRIIVPSPKTEHIPGKGTRTIPLFAELRPYLEEAFELATDGAEYVVDEKLRKAAVGPTTWLNANLRTTFEKISGGLDWNLGHVHSTISAPAGRPSSSKFIQCRWLRTGWGILLQSPCVTI